MAWVRKRRAEKPIVHWTEAPEPIDWPDLPAEAKHGMMKDTLGGQREAGVHLNWKPPPASKIDSARRLLARDGMPTRRTQRRRRRRQQWQRRKHWNQTPAPLWRSRTRQPTPARLMNQALSARG